jgi:threonine/homoserine/homoserine lactone efflux protein
MDIFVSSGIVLGLSAGFSPGPLSTLVISQSLQHGTREGLKVALAPLVTDAPIILVCVFILMSLHNFDSVLGTVAILGALFLLYLAYLNFNTTTIDLDTQPVAPRSLGKGTLVNFLSPSPYVFWLTIGAPNVVEAWSQNPALAVGFLGGFYACLIGGKMSLAVVASHSRRLLTGRAYGYVMRFLGVLLLGLALLMFRDGLKFFGISVMWP